MSLEGSVGAGDLEVFETGVVDKLSGVTPSTASATNSILPGLNRSHTLTFGSNDGAGEINTRAEFESALANLMTPGVKASIDAARKLGLEPNVSSVGDTPNPKRAELIEQYNEIMEQIDPLIQDSGFYGVNLLNGDDLSVLFNEDGSSGLDISGATLDAAGLGLPELGGTGFNDAASTNSVLEGLDAAIGSLRSQASAFGSNLSIVETREDFTKATINTLETGAANLTLADTNEEGANLLALQTRQSLSSTALSLASQADQDMLRLF